MTELRNLNYANDVKYALDVQRCILGTIGVWPISRHRKFWHLTRFFKTLLNVACWLLQSIILIPWAMQVFVIIDTFKVKVKMMAPLCFYIMIPAMYCALLSQQGNMRKCVKHMEDDWRNIEDESDRKIMLKNAKTGRSFGIYSTSCFLICVFIYRIVQPLLRGTMVVNENVTIRPLVQGNYFFFFDAQRSPAYEITFSIQYVASTVMYMVMASVNGLTALLTMHASGQLERLDYWLENFLLEDGPTGYARKFAIIIAHHVRTQKFLHQVEGIIGAMCLVDIMGGTLMLCLLGYNLITGWQGNDVATIVTYAVALTSIIVNMYTLCYVGELLSIQGNKVNTTCCTINWYRLPNKEARYLVILIAMASYPTKLTAMKFVDLSYSSFGAIIRTSMAYLNLLRTVTS